MKHMILSKYIWQNAGKDIKDYVANCMECLRDRNKVKNKEIIRVKSSSINELWVIDIVGPLQINSEGLKYILTKIDHFSGTGDAFALKTKTATEVCKVLENVIIARNGKPKTILMDNGLEFLMNQMIDTSVRQNSKFAHTSPYYPQSAGAIERFNGSAMKKLRKITNFRQLDWVEAIEKVVRAYNLCISRSLGISPDIIRQQGREMYLIDKEITVEDINSDINNKIAALHHRIKKI